MNRAIATAVAMSVAALSACKQDVISITNNQTQGVVDEPGVENLVTVDPAEGNMATGQPNAADQAYVQDAATSDLFEIQSSQLALEKATVPAVKSYAQMMIDEHGKSSAELNAAAQAARLAIPGALPADKVARIEALRGLSGADFDRQYLADQRAGHQETLTMVNGYLATAEPGPLKDHAAKLTGVVQKHLNSLEKIK